MSEPKGLHGVKVWTSAAMPSDRMLTIADLTAFRDSVARGRVAPQVAVMSPRLYDRYHDFLHTEAVRRFLGMVGPFAPITVRGLWRKLAALASTAAHRLRKAALVLRYGYDPEDV